MKRWMVIMAFGVIPALPAAQEKECFANYECDVGSRCIKQPNQRSGFCMKVGDSPKPGSPASPNSDPLLKPQRCTIDLDCAIGFVCDKTYQLCIKRKLK